jgi:hypothetical protein
METLNPHPPTQKCRQKEKNQPKEWFQLAQVPLQHLQKLNSSKKVETRTFHSVMKLTNTIQATTWLRFAKIISLKKSAELDI